MTFPEKITQLRKEVGLTQNRAANLLQVTPAYLCQLELGKRNPSFKVLKNMSTLYQTPIKILAVFAQQFEIQKKKQLTEKKINRKYEKITQKSS